MRNSFRIWFLFGFVALLALITLSVWTYTALTKTTDTSRTAAEREGFFGTLFPFGRGNSTTPTPTSDIGTATVDGSVPRLRKVTQEKVAGAGFATGLSGAFSVRYVERQTGHVYETPVDAPTVERLTNTTLPAIHDARWVSASTTLLRYLTDDGQIENFLGVVTATTTNQPFTGTYLAQYQRSVVGQGVVYGVSETAGGSVGELVTVNTGVVRPIFTSNIRSFVPAIGGTRLFVYSAPTGLAAGSVYEVMSGKFVRLFGNIVGLEVLPHARGDALLLSSGGANSMQLYVGATTSIRTLPLKTSVAKCAWVGSTLQVLCAVPKVLPPATYPDDWYLGRVHTRDDLWLIDTETGVTTLLLDLESETGGLSLDVTQLVVTSDGAYALFIDRNEGALWVATLKNL